jgi:chromosomal replication initiation ATPase DnaA
MPSPKTKTGIALDNYIMGIIKKATSEIKDIKGVEVDIFYRIGNSRNMAELMDAVCSSDVSWNDIVGSSRIRAFCMRRHLFCWFAVNVFGFQKSYTASVICRDHSTIIASCQLVDDMIFTKDEQYLRHIGEVSAKLNIMGDSVVNNNSK